MKPRKAWRDDNSENIPDEMERAKYWANLLHKAVDKHDIYHIAKHNLNNNNENGLKQDKAIKILEAALKRYEAIYNT
jgi:hypothetical protein